jgi:hypothetical protein
VFLDVEEPAISQPMLVMVCVMMTIMYVDATGMRAIAVELAIFIRSVAIVSAGTATLSTKPMIVHQK